MNAPTPSAVAGSVQQPQASVNHITRQRVVKIVLQLKNQYGWTGREFEAVCKASVELEAGFWSWDQPTRTLTIASRTKINKRYHVGEHTCCDAANGQSCRQQGKIHWHHAAWAILDLASQPERVITPQTDEEFATTLDRADELFS